MTKYRRQLGFEDYFKNRHLYGYGVEESVSADLLAKIQEVINVVDGEKR